MHLLRASSRFFCSYTICQFDWTWARSIQPKFQEISVQNLMDRFGPTEKVSKKLVHLLRWSTFFGRTGLKFGWMDRAPWQALQGKRDWIISGRPIGLSKDQTFCRYHAKNNVLIFSYFPKILRALLARASTALLETFSSSRGSHHKKILELSCQIHRLDV